MQFDVKRTKIQQSRWQRMTKRFFNTNSKGPEYVPAFISSDNPNDIVLKSIYQTRIEEGQEAIKTEGKV